jgi:hypothetical protein
MGEVPVSARHHPLRREDRPDVTVRRVVKGAHFCWGDWHGLLCLVQGFLLAEKEEALFVLWVLLEKGVHCPLLLPMVAM